MSGAMALPAAMHGLQLADALTGQPVKVSGGKVRITVPALFGSVLVNR
ncbi:hypothetical protein [Pseudoduganella sp. GCM10020061]